MINDYSKSKKQLITELIVLRQQANLQQPASTKVGITNKQHYHVLGDISCDCNECRQTKFTFHQDRHIFQTLAENSLDIIARIDKNLRFIYVNSIIKIPTGINAQSFIGAHLCDMISDQCSVELWTRQINKVFTTNRSARVQSEFENSHKKHFFYDAHFVPEFGLNGTVQYVLCTIRNITNLKKAEQALRKTEDYKEHLLHFLPDVLFIFNDRGIIEDYQSFHKQLTTFTSESFIGKSIATILPSISPSILYYMEQARSTNNVQLFQFQVKIENTTYFFDGRLIANSSNEFILIARDVTDLQRLQQQLALFDRLNLVGEMAVSIGHEIRNPMTTVRGFLQLFQRKVAFLPYRDSLNLMLTEIDHANMIITEFISLSKNKALVLEQQSLNSIIIALAPLIQADAVLTNKQLTLELNPLPDILLDGKEIRQLILNIAHNGLEAMPSNSELIIGTYVGQGSIILAITDNGAGIAPEHIEKIPTPFFSTKENKPGLGLAICYSIAARHHAEIHFTTSPTGTTFYVKFNQLS
jgi:PAS domain S-box-containing protein